MLNLKKNLIITLLLVVLLAISNNVFASGINMNLSSESNVTDNSTLTNGISSNTAITSAVISTVENIEDNHNSSFGINTILDILLIAIGLVIILLAIAILIRLKH